MASKEELIAKNLIQDDSKIDAIKLKEFCKNNLSENVFVGDEIDLSKLKNLLGLSSLNGYELKFPGKGIANALYSQPNYKELKGQKSPKIDENFIIKGDNLDALKILAKGYTNKIKMIYIDPPYNTGKENEFIYNDNFRADFKTIAKACGLISQSGEESKILKEMQSMFKGTKTHSAWLCFMYPRLKLARDLLKDDGVIFISIDDNEQANLKLLCDEIFGEENFVADFIRKTKSTTNDAKTGINYQHEFLYCYAKNKENVNLLGGQKDLSKYKNPDNDPNGAWVSSDPSAKSGTPQNGYFGVTNPYTSKVDYPPEGRFWLFSQNTLQKHIDEGRICFKKEHKDDERGFIYKRYLKDLKTDLTTFDSLKFVDNKFMNQSATKGLKELNMVEAFSYPKSVEFIQEIINHATNNNHDIILDFFAGSGTTAHAVMAQNAQDNGNRKFILVQLDEKIDEKKSRTAFDFCKNELGSKEPVISDITIERVKRAKKALNSQMEFSVYEIDDEPEIDLEKGVIRNNISAIDLVTNMLLKSGNEIGGKEIICVIENKLYKVNNDYFVINLDNKGEIFENDDVKQIFGILNQDRNGNVFADMYMDCHIQNWLNFREKFKERLRII